ncbi:hypothetical protein B4N89_30620 [Embleya scabrispora]|uniref:5'-3' exonuclease n=1 Tax=Embleya scabrispora TaxID=159449 RepID=A0A1T3P6K1_9ACTN|nr:hypothetical protein [Embleya scabrispora]OPC84694.1 hypothetical protein B4N89_30620 [Embleya scabrispora]
MRGESTWPWPDHRRCLEAVFERPVVDTGFVPPRNRGRTPEPRRETGEGPPIPRTHRGTVSFLVTATGSDLMHLDRRNFMTMAGAAALTPASAWLRKDPDADTTGDGTSARVEDTQVTRIRRRIDDLRLMDDDLGGGDLITLISADLAYITSRLRHGRNTDVNVVKDALDHTGIRWSEHRGCEADDVIATLITRARANDRLVDVMSADKDFVQLLADPGVRLLNTGFREDRRYTIGDQIRPRHGVTAEQWPDYRALTGDPADNIRGLRGVHGRTAANVTVLPIRKGGSCSAYVGMQGSEAAVRIRKTVPAVVFERDSGRSPRVVLATSASATPASAPADNDSTDNSTPSTCPGRRPGSCAHGVGASAGAEHEDRPTGGTRLRPCRVVRPCRVRADDVRDPAPLGHAAPGTNIFASWPAAPITTPPPNAIDATPNTIRRFVRARTSASGMRGSRTERDATIVAGRGDRLKNGGR